MQPGPMERVNIPRRLYCFPLTDPMVGMVPLHYSSAITPWIRCPRASFPVPRRALQGIRFVGGMGFRASACFQGSAPPLTKSIRRKRNRIFQSPKKFFTISLVLAGLDSEGGGQDESDPGCVQVVPYISSTLPIDKIYYPYTEQAFPMPCTNLLATFRVLVLAEDEGRGVQDVPYSTCTLRIEKKFHTYMADVPKPYETGPFQMPPVIHLRRETPVWRDSAVIAG
jgi:hypothetical protein